MKKVFYHHPYGDLMVITMMIIKCLLVYMDHYYRYLLVYLARCLVTFISLSTPPASSNDLRIIV